MKKPDHYRQDDLSDFEVAERWKSPIRVAHALKYLRRFRYKNGAEDLRKAILCIQLQIMEEKDE